MALRYVLGVDPGLKGAIAYFCLVESLAGQLCSVFDMPLMEDAPSKKKVVDGGEIARRLDVISTTPGIFAVIEKVHAMPGQGVTSMFNFGKSYGIVIGVLQTLAIPIFYVPPAVWKSTIGLSQNKKQSRQAAEIAFPSHKSYFSRAKDDGRAEAALLAKFGAERIAPTMTTITGTKT